MNSKYFFENFELLAESPNAIQKLREMILQMAVQGKLMPQDENDESVDVLLEKIIAEKERLVKDKKKMKTSLETITKDEMPFEIPQSWRFLKLTDFGEVLRGVTYKKHDSSNEHLPEYSPLLRANNINVNINFDKLIYIPKEKINSSQFIKAWDILIAMSSGSKNLVGKAAQAEEDLNCGFGAFCGLIRLLPIVYRKYIGYYFHSPYYRNTVMGFGKGIGINNLRKTDIENLIVPLPPLEEQKRIVAKVDQLMAICDQLESFQQKKNESCIHLNNSALSKMLDADSPKEFAEYWRLVCENFDLLYDNLDNVKKFKQAILQLAVQGKLVEQNENDEPAEVLLEQKDNKKILSYIQSENFKSKLPDGWRYCFLNEISEIIMGNSPPGNSYNEIGEGVLLINGPVEFSKGPFGKTIKSKYTTQPTKFCDEGDLLICVRGSTTGRTNIASFKACIGRGVASIRAKFYQDYINYFILAKRQEIFDSGKGSTFPSITTKQINEMIVPLPPLEEQKRIVAKVDQLMVLCDQLEAKIRQAQSDSDVLMEVAVKYLLEA